MRLPFLRRHDRHSSTVDPAEAHGRAAAALAGATWPAGLAAALARLAGGDGQAWLVGGTVRDAVLGRPLRSPLDVATDLTPPEVQARFPRVEPIGIAHGTVLVIEDGLALECTTLRREGAYGDARRPDRVEFTRDPLEDLARRDFTCNAMAWDPVHGVLLDPYDGAGDLERGVLRAVGDPRRRFEEDGLRPLRAARFAATHGLTVEPGTRAALGSARDRAAQVAMERVRQELERMMAAPRPSVGFELMRGAGLLALWLPELEACVAVPQNRHHAWDVYWHLLHTCDAAPADKPRVRWAALLHDIGKPATRVMRRGDATFYGHEQVGAELADGLLRRLRFANDEREAIVHLVRQHMFDYRAQWSGAAVRRWLRRVGLEHVADLFDLRIADNLGNGLKDGTLLDLESLRLRIEREIEAAHALRVRDLAVDGRDVMEVLGVAAGPGVGAVLERLLEEVLEDPSLNRRETLLERLAAMARERRAEP
jgi:tRNA nucleotidyltransferase (CCA-adding enzyme)